MLLYRFSDVLRQAALVCMEVRDPNLRELACLYNFCGSAAAFLEQNSLWCDPAMQQ